jgi:hypothetical protein
MKEDEGRIVAIQSLSDAQLIQILQWQGVEEFDRRSDAEAR